MASLPRAHLYPLHDYVGHTGPVLDQAHALPRLLKVINLIPWKMRYSLTTVVTVLMLVNGVMTLQSLDCWFCRESDQAQLPVEEFYAQHFDNEYMAHRFQTMTIHPDSSSRVDSPVPQDAQ